MKERSDVSTRGLSLKIYIIDSRNIMTQHFYRKDLNFKNWGTRQLARTQFWTKINDIENKRDARISILGQFNINSIKNNYLFLAFQISNNLVFLMISEIKPDGKFWQNFSFFEITFQSLLEWLDHWSKSGDFLLHIRHTSCLLLSECSFECIFLKVMREVN